MCDLFFVNLSDAFGFWLIQFKTTVKKSTVVCFNEREKKQPQQVHYHVFWEEVASETMLTSDCPSEDTWEAAEAVCSMRLLRHFCVDSVSISHRMCD